MNSLGLVGLSAIGFAISVYFTAVTYRWMRPDPRWIPSFCRLEKQTCTLIIFTPQARVFGPPNSALGVVYYGALIVGVALGFIDEPPFAQVVLGASAVTVGLALYLSYSLLFVIRVPCLLCFTSHGINVAILVLLLLR